MAVTFKSPPLVTQDVIDQAARDLGVSFPSEYADFLLKVNGGVSKPRKLQVDAGEFTIDRFYSLSAIPAPKKPLDVVSNLVAMNLSLRGDGCLGLPTGVLAIGLVDGQNILSIIVQGAAIGTVSSWSTEVSAISPGMTPLASSFSNLLHDLEHPSEKAKARVELQKQFDKLESAIVNRKWAAVKKLVEQLDLSQWRPVVHPVFSAIADRDVDCVKRLFELGVSFVIEDSFHGGTPLKAAAQKLQGDIDFLTSAKPRADGAMVKKWESYIVADRSIHSYLQDQGVV